MVADFENLGVVDVEGELLVLQLEHVIGGSGRVHEVVARAGLSDHEDKDKQKTIFDFKFKINRFQIFKKDKRICGLTFELFVCYPMFVEYWPVVTKVSERSGIGQTN